jgi:hypothetical protein
MIRADKYIHGMMVKVFLLKYNPIAAIFTKTLYLSRLLLKTLMTTSSA